MTPNLRIRVLHFKDGISQLGGRQSISAEPTNGVPSAESIQRIPGGYLIGWKVGDHVDLFVVPDHNVICVKVADMDLEAAAPAKEEVEAAPSAPVVHRVSEAELQARAAREERKRIAEERVRERAAEMAREMGK